MRAGFRHGGRGGLRSGFRVVRPTLPHRAALGPGPPREHADTAGPVAPTVALTVLMAGSQLDDNHLRAAHISSSVRAMCTFAMGWASGGLAAAHHISSVQAGSTPLGSKFSCGSAIFEPRAAGTDTAVRMDQVSTVARM